MTTGAVAADGDLRGVAVEVADILVGPLEGEALVPETTIGGVGGE